jgi:hypothetical protein
MREGVDVLGHCIFKCSLSFAWFINCDAFYFPSVGACNWFPGLVSCQGRFDLCLLLYAGVVTLFAWPSKFFCSP